jgi:streptogramin lyase
VSTLTGATLTVVPHAIEYALAAGSGPTGLTNGPDGNVWITESNTSSIAKMLTNGTYSEYSCGATCKPFQIVTGPDGYLWFSDASTGGFAGGIDRISIQGSVAQIFTSGTNNPLGICVGPDANIWFTEGQGRSVGRVTTGGSGKFMLAPGDYLWGISAGPDGNIWFAENGTDKIAKFVL